MASRDGSIDNKEGHAVSADAETSTSNMSRTNKKTKKSSNPALRKVLAELNVPPQLLGASDEAILWDTTFMVHDSPFESLQVYKEEQCSRPRERHQQHWTPADVNVLEAAGTELKLVRICGTEVWTFSSSVESLLATKALDRSQASPSVGNFARPLPSLRRLEPSKSDSSYPKLTLTRSAHEGHRL